MIFVVLEHESRPNPAAKELSSSSTGSLHEKCDDDLASDSDEEPDVEEPEFVCETSTEESDDEDLPSTTPR